MLNKNPIVSLKTDSNGEEVESFLCLSRVRPPVLVVVEVDVAAERSELVRIVSVGKDESGSVERITVKKGRRRRIIFFVPKSNVLVFFFAVAKKWN